MNSVPSPASDPAFRRLCQTLQAEFRHGLSPSERLELLAFVQKRQKALGQPSLVHYQQYVLGPQGQQRELPLLAAQISPEQCLLLPSPSDFDPLLHSAVPERMRTQGAGIHRPLVLWCVQAGAGALAYSMAIVLSEFGEQIPGLGFRFVLLATDQSALMQQLASRAIYAQQAAGYLAQPLQHKYLLRGKGDSAGLIRLCPKLRETVKNRKLNVWRDPLGFREPIDIIYCRHLSGTQSPDSPLPWAQMLEHLSPGGYLFAPPEPDAGLPLESLIAVDTAVYQKAPAGTVCP